MASLLKSKAIRLADYIRAGRVPTRIGSWRGQRRLSPRPGLTPLTKSSIRLNHIASRLPNCDLYLEVGVESGATFENVRVDQRWGVDPRPLFDVRELPEGIQFFQETSDCFFSRRDLPTFDLIFVDGLHIWAQAYRDVINAMRCAGPHAVLLLDDCVPSDAISAIPDQFESYKMRRQLGQSGTEWCGDVYRVLYVLDRWHPELEFATVVEGRGPGYTSGQALIWFGPLAKQPEIREFSPSEVVEIESVSWSDVFARDALPPFLRSESEAAALGMATKKASNER